MVSELIKVTLRWLIVSVFIVSIIYWQEVDTLFRGFTEPIDPPVYNGSNDINPKALAAAGRFNPNGFHGLKVADDTEIIFESGELPFSEMIVETVGDSGFWRPLMMMSFKFDKTMWGYNPFMYHVTQIVFHALVCFLLAWLCFTITNSFLATGIVIITFGLSSNTEVAVRWLGARSDIMIIAFILLATIHSIKSKKIGYMSTVLFALCTMLCKESGIVVIPILILIEMLRWSNTSLRNTISLGIAMLFYVTTHFVISYGTSVITPNYFDQDNLWRALRVLAPNVENLGLFTLWSALIVPAALWFGKFRIIAIVIMVTKITMFVIVMPKFYLPGMQYGYGIAVCDALLTALAVQSTTDLAKLKLRYFRMKDGASFFCYNNLNDL